MRRARRLRSSLIDRVLHDDETETLSIWFRNRRAYVYERVPVALYDAFVHAGSAGSFFNAAIKGHYPCHRLGKRYAP